MTNTEIIQAIRNEIERLKEEAYNSILPDEPKYRTHYKVGKKELCEELLSFLSTLESEKPMNPGDAMKELDEKIALVKQRGTWDGVDVDKYMDEVRGREPEKPVPADLEKAAIDIADTLLAKPKDYALLARVDYWNGAHDGVIAGAKWQENKDQETIKLAEDHAFLAGADWQKEQMLKEAVETTVVESYGYDKVDEATWKQVVIPTIHFTTEKYMPGDKVRIIICKKEDEK